MIGFILGAACAVGIAKMLRRRAWYRHFGHGGYGPGYGSPGGFRGMRGMRGMGGGGMRTPGRWALRSVFERLETTPGQERVILAALDELRENRKAVRDEAKQSRVDLAHAVEGGLIEDSTLEEALRTPRPDARAASRRLHRGAEEGRRSARRGPAQGAGALARGRLLPQRLGRSRTRLGPDAARAASVRSGVSARACGTSALGSSRAGRRPGPPPRRRPR